MFFSNTSKIMVTIDTKSLFGVRIKENTLNNLIMNDDFPCIQYIYNLSVLLKKEQNNMNDLDEYKKIFYDNKNIFKDLGEGIFNNLNKENLFDKNNTLFSYFSCINLIARILKYGKFKNNVKLNCDDKSLTITLLLNVFETEIDEELDNNEQNPTFLNLYLSVIGYNQFSNDISCSNYFRLPYLYENYISKNSFVEKSFLQQNGYSIKAYILFLQIFLLFGSYNNPLINISLNNTDLAKEIDLCIRKHIFNYYSKNEKNNIIINSYIPSKNIIDFPIITFNDNYIVLNPGFMLSRIHRIFFENIKKALPKSYFNKTFYGPLFENYCKNIAKINISRSNFKYYNYIDTFKYHYNKNSKESSDFYINYNDITIIFEIKSTTRYKETTTETNLIGKEKYIDKEVDTKIIKPFNQIENRLSEILKLNPTHYPNIQQELIKIQNSKKFYYVVVSDESIINNILFYNTYLSKLKPKYSNYIPLYINISEFEYLMMSLYKRKKAIHTVLEHYHKNYYSSNLYEMILKEKTTYKFKRLDIFNKKIYENDLKKILL